ncbi:hypothetical protein ACLIA0_03955 [Bacillaceae bacterium W0354]
MRYLTEDELKTASRYLFLSMAIIVLEKDIKQIEVGAFKIKEPYLKLLHRMETIAKNERRTLRKKMQSQKISVVLTEKNDTFTTYLFLARGYEEEKRYFNPAIRKKVEQIYEELLVEVSKSTAQTTSGG